jgi:hypothetical protein
VEQNYEGRVAVTGRVTGPGVTTGTTGNNLGNWLEDATGVPRLYARQGQNGDYLIFRPDGFIDNGTLVFTTYQGGSPSYPESVWRLPNGGTRELLATRGQQAPGLQAGVVFDDEGIPVFDSVFNSAGHLGLEIRLLGPGITYPFNHSFWTDREGSGLQLVIKSGDAAPETPNSLISTIGPSEFNGASRFAGVFTTQSTIDLQYTQGLFAEDKQKIFHLIARNGGPAPGADDGQVFGGASRTDSEGTAYGLNWIDQNTYQFNDQNEAAFIGHLSGSGTSIANDTGIWAMTHQKNLSLIVRTGDMFDVGNNDFRQLKDLTLQDFNSAGELVFWAAFTDGSSGMFVANVNAVPEPSSFLLLLGSIALFRLHRARTK